MHIIFLAVSLHQFCLEVGADRVEDAAHLVEGGCGDDPAPILGHKDQMDVEVKDAMPPVANIVVIAHRPNYTGAMHQLQAYKFQLRPNGEHARQMSCFAGCCRFVWNKALALQKARYERGEKKLGYAGLCTRLTQWRNSPETVWLADAPVHPLQQSLKDLERAYANFFAKRADVPRFKKKGQGDRFRYPDPKQFKLDEANSRIFLPKLGWMRYRKSRNIEGTPKRVTVSRVAGTWYFGIQTERDVEAPQHPATSVIGIDLGVAKFATCSNGTIYAPGKSYRQHQARLARHQRAMSRKTKFSGNWKTAKRRVAKLHERIANLRRDFLHKASTDISKNHAVVVIEDLKVANMSKSAKGTRDAPGRNVRAKSSLNKSILDQGWFEFRRQLEYKEAWRGGFVVAVDPRNTSRTCLACGNVSSENRRTQERFECVECGYAENADLNAARNILAAGHAVLACGELA